MASRQGDHRPADGQGAAATIGRLTAWLAYNWAMGIAAIMALPVLSVAVLSSPKRRMTFRQRLGWWTYSWEGRAGRDVRPTIWVHALSMGELTAAQPLIRYLTLLQGAPRVVLSTSTFSGFQTARKLFGSSPIDLAYFPYDLLWSVRKVVRKIRPSAIILVETDLWPNFLMETSRRRIPVFIVNLRLSPRSWKRLTYFRPIVKAALGVVAKICTQTEEDARRLTRLGVAPGHIAVTGNLKFDSPLPDVDRAALESWRRRLGIQPLSQVIVAGSTHAGEEAMLLDALVDTFGRKVPKTLLIIVPRDPQRATQVLELCRRKSMQGGLLSRMDPGGSDTCWQVVVVDSIGRLKFLYGLADIAFVGGSLVPRGGHNPLEPAALGKAVIFGADMGDFPQIANLLLAGDAARQVHTPGELKAEIEALLADPAKRDDMGQRALAIVGRHQGAVKRTIDSLGLFNGCQEQGGGWVAASH